MLSIYNCKGKQRGSSSATNDNFPPCAALTLSLRWSAATSYDFIYLFSKNNFRQVTHLDTYGVSSPALHQDVLTRLPAQVTSYEFKLAYDRCTQDEANTIHHEESYYLPDPNWFPSSLNELTIWHLPDMLDQANFTSFLNFLSHLPTHIHAVNFVKSDHSIANDSLIIRNSLTQNQILAALPGTVERCEYASIPKNHSLSDASRSTFFSRPLPTVPFENRYKPALYLALLSQASTQEFKALHSALIKLILEFVSEGNGWVARNNEAADLTPHFITNKKHHALAYLHAEAEKEETLDSAFAKLCSIYQMTHA